MPWSSSLARIDSACGPRCSARRAFLHGRVLRPLLQSSWVHPDSPAFRCGNRCRLLLAYLLDQRRPPIPATLILRMSPPELFPRIAALPKAELHLHLEGAIRPRTLHGLMARHGVIAAEEEVREHYRFVNFQGFLETFKWVTSFLREPQDYALVVNDLGERLLEQNVVYAEVTLS